MQLGSRVILSARGQSQLFKTNEHYRVAPLFRHLFGRRGSVVAIRDDVCSCVVQWDGSQMERIGKAYLREIEEVTEIHECVVSTPEDSMSLHFVPCDDSDSEAATEELSRDFTVRDFSSA